MQYYPYSKVNKNTIMAPIFVPKWFPGSASGNWNAG